MIMQILRKLPFHPILFAVNSVLAFYFSYYYDTTIIEVLLTIVIATLFVIVTWVIFNRLLRDIFKSSLMVFISITFLFSNQSVVHQLRKAALSQNKIDLCIFWHSNHGQVIVFILLLLPLIAAYFLVGKIRRINPKITIYMNLVSIILILISTARGFQSITQHSNNQNLFRNYWQQELERNVQSTKYSSIDKPDIYYIILDGFTRTDVLQEFYGLDNSDFIDVLSNRGFYVASESYSNYTQTRSSLASSLNMMYLDNVENLLKENTSYYYPSYLMIDESLVEQSMQLLGYETVSIRSEISFMDLPDWDVYLQPKLIPRSFLRTFLSTTAMSIVMNPLIYRWHRNSIEFALDSLPRAGLRVGPQFILAHILCPHPPFVFQSDGTPLKADRLFTTQDANYFFTSGTIEEYRQGYPDQMVYLQNRVLETVDEIFSTAQDPVILIIQGDHGSGMQLDQTSLENTNIHERLGILNAYYFFDKNYVNLYSQISPVNSFRLILSQYFDIPLPLLPDRHFYSKYHELFKFVAVDHLLE